FRKTKIFGFNERVDWTCAQTAAGAFFVGTLGYNPHAEARVYPLNKRIDAQPEANKGPQRAVELGQVAGAVSQPHGNHGRNPRYHGHFAPYEKAKRGLAVLLILT